MHPIQVWRRWTTPTTDGEVARRREIVLLTVLGAMVVLSVATQLIQLAEVASGASVDALKWWPLNLAVGAGFYGLLRLARAGRQRISAAALLAILGSLAAIMVLAGGINDPIWALLLALAVFLGAILLGPRVSLAVVAAGAVVAIPALVLQHAGVVPLAAAADRPTDVGDIVAFLALLAFLGLICSIYTRDVLTSIDEALSRNSPSSPLRRLRTKGLTMREVEVVQLVAEGLSNDAIARRLFVSPRTVQSHVANAMKKCGAANRTELGVLAIREGLVALHEKTGADVPRDQEDL